MEISDKVLAMLLETTDRSGRLKAMSNEQVGALLMLLNREKPMFSYESDLIDDAAERLLGGRMTAAELDQALDETDPIEIDVDRIIESVHEQTKAPVYMDEVDRLKAKLLAVSKHVELMTCWTDGQRAWLKTMMEILNG